MSNSIQKIRQDFPILKRLNRGKPLVYLDNAASSQKPDCVIEALAEYYKEHNSNVHRGVYALAEEAELLYHDARKTIADWFNVSSEEIIFVRGATEGLNLVAQSFSQSYLNPGDSIILTQMEHHANIVPWQMVAKQRGVEIQVVSILKDGSLDLDELNSLLAQQKTKVLSLCHISNSLGTINPVEQIIEEAHSHDVHVIVDGAQSVPHGKLDLKAMNCDFFTFSGHKVFGPMGIGVLYGKKEILESLPPYQGGGDMIDEVSFSGTTYAPTPQRFEAGTPNVSGAIGLATAIDYLRQHDMNELARHENEPKLEKLLYKLFMILPAEASNSKTRFMENRLWFSELSKSAKLKMNTFGNRQGLIQIQHDFCRNFHQGCVRCELPRLLED